MENQDTDARGPLASRLNCRYIDHIAGAVMVVDRAGVIVEVNEPAAVMSAMSPAELVGSHVGDDSWWPGPCVNEDGGRLGADEVPALRAIASGRDQDFVFGILMPPDGVPVWLLTSCRLLRDDHGAVIACVISMTDVTAQKRAEGTLTSVAAELHGVLHALPDLFFHLDAGGLIVDYHIGAGFDAITVPEDYLGRSAADLLSPDLAARANAARARALLSGGVEVFEGAFDAGDQTLHLEFRFVALPERDMVVLVRDISEQRDAESHLRASEARYRAMFERAQVGMFRFDRDLRIVECNDQFCRQTGKTRDFFVGLSILSLKDQRIVPALRAALRGELGQYDGDYVPSVGGIGGAISLVAQPLYSPQGEIEGGTAALMRMQAAPGAADAL